MLTVPLCRVTGCRCGTIEGEKESKKEPTITSGPYGSVPGKDSGNVSKHRIAVMIAATLVTVAGAVAQEYADIRLPNKLIARVRAVGPYGTLAQREAAIYQRITNALSNELDNVFDQELGGPRLTVYQSDGIWTLSIGNQMLIQAFEEDAAGAGVTTRQLIHQWKANYAQQLPRAVSPIRVPEWWQQANPEAVGTEEKRMHDLPAHDAVLVREVCEILDATREMPTERFEELQPAMERLLLQRIWTYRHPECGEPPIEEHIRCRSVLRRAHGLSDEQYAMEQWWLAGETIKRLRDAMDVPEGVGPIPEQQDLPDLDRLSEPIAAPTAPVPTEPVATTTEPVAVTADRETDVEPISIASGTPIQIAAIGTGLGEGSHLLNMGQEFTVPIHQLLVYVQIAEAAPGTVLGVALRRDEAVISQRRIPLNGDRKLAVTFKAGPAEGFEPGEYDALLTIKGVEAGRIPFQIHGMTGTL